MMNSPIPTRVVPYGFTVEGLGAHSSRTIMLKELKLLLAACPPDTDTEGYHIAILEDNVLLKRTESTRRKSFRHLRELYGLNRSLLIFRALRSVWDHDAAAQPALALLCAIARDPSLRSTAELILSLPRDAPVTSGMLAQAAESHFPGLSRATTLATIGRNAASSWTQSGHLVGRRSKVRAQAPSHPTSVAYALLLGHLCGAQGEALFRTLWARILDNPVHTLREQAMVASQQGWLEYRRAGDVTDITFHHFLREASYE